ncbi:MAG: hypothetical protein GW878_01880 [Acidobacteria bacterium]|nr:hypothetical protein [Acidobacteriota bacterium]
MRARAIDGVLAAAAEMGLRSCARIASPIAGPAGNIEELVWFTLDDGCHSGQDASSAQR